MFVTHFIILDTTPAVAFTAYAENTVDYNAGHTVKFDKVLVNKGNFYNAGSGVFYCEYEGTYMFSLTVRSNEGQAMSAQIVKNEVPFLKSYSGTDHTAQGSISVAPLRKWFGFNARLTVNNLMEELVQDFPAY